MTTIDETFDRFNLQAELASLSLPALAAYTARAEWLVKARKKQLPPTGDWSVLLALAGRGWGKTLCGAQWLWHEAWRDPGSYNFVIAPTHDDLRGTCYEGPTGLLACIPEHIVRDYNKSTMEISLVNDSLIRGFSAQDPDRLRGPQASRGWFDELAAWQYPEQAFDMAMFGMRLGDHPKVLATTTPRPHPLIFRLMKDPKTLVVQGSTYDNRANLPEAFFAQIAVHEGTQLGRQEIHGEVLDPEESGIFKRSWFKLWPSGKALPEFELVVQSYDTATSEKDLKTNAQTACTTWGLWRPKDSKGWNAILCDAWADNLGYPDLRKKAVEQWNVKYGDPPKRAEIVLIEDKSSGISLRQDLHRAGVPVRPYNPGRSDKVQRAHAVSHLVMGGLVWLPESMKRPGQPRDWIDPFLGQVCSFPATERMDYVDTFTQFLALMRDQGWLFVDKIPDEPEYADDVKRHENPYAV